MNQLQNEWAGLTGAELKTHHGGQEIQNLQVYENLNYQYHSILICIEPSQASFMLFQGYPENYKEDRRIVLVKSARAQESLLVFLHAPS